MLAQSICYTSCPKICSKLSDLRNFGIYLCEHQSQDKTLFNGSSLQTFVLRAFVSRMVEAVDMNESRSYAHACQLILQSVM